MQVKDGKKVDLTRFSCKFSGEAPGMTADQCPSRRQEPGAGTDAQARRKGRELGLGRGGPEVLAAH